MLQTAHVLEVSARPTAVVRLCIPRSEIRTVMGPAIGEVIAAAHAQDVGPAGPLFSHHFRVDPEVFDFEVGVPVDEPVTPVGRVEASELPACKVARAIYPGPYEALATAWGELDEWIEKSGLTPAENLWEVYLAGPDTSPDPDRWLTELNRPLK